MLTVRAKAESGGQSDRDRGLQLEYVCAEAGREKRVAEARAATTLATVRIVEDMRTVVECTGEISCSWELGNLDTGGLKE